MVTIQSFEGFDHFVRALSPNTIFRGVNKTTYKLVPSVGRHKPCREATHLQMEKRLLQLFKESSAPYIGQSPQNAFEWLALAQHHGLPTRLLDWTYNPLVALYFAVDKHVDCDCIVYAYRGGTSLQPEEINSKDPFKLKKVIRYRPSHISRRIATQAGLFTVHPNPQTPFTGDNVERIRVKSHARRDLKKILAKYGVSSRYLFPDLDGLAESLKWLEVDGH